MAFGRAGEFSFSREHAGYETGVLRPRVSSVIRELCGTSLKEIARLFSLGSYGSPGGACSVIEGQIKGDRKLHRRIEQIREMASSTFSQTKA